MKRQQAFLVPLPGTFVLGMVCTPISCFSAPKGKYLEPATSSDPIETNGYEIHPDFISLVRELNFLESNPQDFEEMDVLNFLEIE
jgi:hypothetical protein